MGRTERDHGEPGAPENLLPVILKSSMQGPDCLSWSLGAGGTGEEENNKVVSERGRERERQGEKK